MIPRDTSTGAVLENMINSALEHGKYRYRKQVIIGERLGGGKHKIDLVIADQNENKMLISLKWQQVLGTAEQKVPFEVICLIKAIDDSKGEFKKAYMVLGGGGWKLRDFYVGGGLQKYIHNMEHITILTLEKFIALANNGKL